MRAIKTIKRLILMMAFTVLMAVYSAGGQTAFAATKYYSLKELGMSGCTTDRVDYGVLSIKGKTVRYVKYELSEKTNRWVQTGGVKTATLTSKTKYYLADPAKISSDSQPAGRNKTPKKAKKTMRKKPRSIDTEKWILKTNKRKIKKHLQVRNNEIRIVKGKVTKILIGIKG